MKQTKLTRMEYTKDEVCLRFGFKPEQVLMIRTYFDDTLTFTLKE